MINNFVEIFMDLWLAHRQNRNEWNDCNLFLSHSLQKALFLVACCIEGNEKYSV